MLETLGAVPIQNRFRVLLAGLWEERIWSQGLNMWDPGSFQALQMCRFSLHSALASQQKKAFLAYEEL